MERNIVIGVFEKPGMNHRQALAIVAPLVISVVMVPIFKQLGNICGEIGWYLG